MKFSVLYGSHRENRAGIKVANYVVEKLQQSNHHVDFFDAKELDLPLLDKRYSDYEEGQAPAILEHFAQTIKTSDGLVLVAGEYNFSIQPGLKNMLDHFYIEYKHRPAALVLYSASDFGGLRAGMQLVQTMWGLQMATIPGALIVPRVGKAFQEDGTPAEGNLDDRMEKFIMNVEWYARAFKNEREAG